MEYGFSSSRHENHILWLMGSTAQRCDDAETNAAVTEYSTIPKALIYLKPYEPATVTRVREAAGSERFARCFSLTGQGNEMP